MNRIVIIIIIFFFKKIDILCCFNLNLSVTVKSDFDLVVTYLALIKIYVID